MGRGFVKARGVALLIALLATAATAAIASTAHSIVDTITDRPGAFALLLVATLGLQLLSLDLGGNCSVGTAAIGMIAAAAILGAPATMVIAVCVAVEQWLRRRGLAHRALFDASNLALASGSAAVAYEMLTPARPTLASSFAAVAVAGAVYAVVNNGLLCLVMSVAEWRSPKAVWNERFQWASVAFLVLGPLAGVVVVNYRHSAVGGAASLTLLASLLLLTMRGGLEQTVVHESQPSAPG
jgi:hypothetical protein